MRLSAQFMRIRHELGRNAPTAWPANHGSPPVGICASFHQCRNRTIRPRAYPHPSFHCLPPLAPWPSATRLHLRLPQTGHLIAMDGGEFLFVTRARSHGATHPPWNRGRCRQWTDQFNPRIKMPRAESSYRPTVVDMALKTLWKQEFHGVAIGRQKRQRGAAPTVPRSAVTACLSSWH